jgi:hypothetical protein
MHVITWLWSQPNARVVYTAENVNTWARMVRRNTTLDVRLSCVTDAPDGIDSTINIIPLPATVDFHNPHWSGAKGLPQCYRRLDMWRADAAETYGERFLSMDLDCIINANIDHILNRTEDFLMYRGTSPARPFNGSMVLMDAGCRPQVFEQFTPAGAIEASAKFVGSDQAWLAHVLGWGEKTIGEESGIWWYHPQKYKSSEFRKNAPILFFPGAKKPWQFNERELIERVNYR